MIGNKIEFYHYNKDYSVKNDPEIRTGTVVDAFTNIKGRISGSSEVILGFGGGTTSGRTESSRTYKVQWYEAWDDLEQNPQYIDIQSWQLKRIVSFAGQVAQEVNDEKINLNYSNTKTP